MSEFTLDLSSVVDELEEDIQDTVIRRFALGVFTRCQKRAPVDTGRFRSSIIVSFDNPSNSTRSRANGTPKGQPDPISLQRAANKLNGFSLDKNQDIYIQSNLPYAEKLESGRGSSQATEGIFGISLREESTAFDTTYKSN